MPFKFNRLTLLANTFSLQFIEISEHKPFPSYRASKSRFFPYIHRKFCPTEDDVGGRETFYMKRHTSKRIEELWTARIDHALSHVTGNG